MEPFFVYYLTCWLAACCVALALYLKHPQTFAISHAAYWRFLGEPWKLATFAIAATGITAIAPFTGDPTWDHVDALFMAVLTFASAPWAVGILFLAIRRCAPLAQAYVAVCAWLFSASWSYDLYLVIRDGDYPSTWFANIFASSVLYLSAGLLWNLEWRPGRGVIFAFMRENWPSSSGRSRFSRLAWIALPFMAIAAVAILSFVIPHAFE